MYVLFAVFVDSLGRLKSLVETGYRTFMEWGRGQVALGENTTSDRQYKALGLPWSPQECPRAIFSPEEGSFQEFAPFREHEGLCAVGLGYSRSSPQGIR